MICSAHGPRRTGGKSLRFLLRSEDEARDEFIDALGIRTLIPCRSSQERISRISVAR
jgi:hypothetical protein